MEHQFIYFLLAGLFGLFMAWGIGANDVANAMATSIGSGALTIRRALIVAAVFEFGGAVLAGGEVTSTIRSGIVESSFVVNEPQILVLGMLAALLSDLPRFDIRIRLLNWWRRNSGRVRKAQLASRQGS